MKNKQRRIACLHLPPETMESFDARDALWHESEEDVARGLVEGRRKKLLLNWVRRQMRRYLTDVERRCIELHYFKGLSFRDAAQRLGVAPSSVQRGTQRGIRKLRVAKKRDRSWRKILEDNE